jgi:hypothetical protein
MLSHGSRNSLGMNCPKRGLFHGATGAVGTNDPAARANRVWTKLWPTAKATPYGACRNFHRSVFMPRRRIGEFENGSGRRSPTVESLIVESALSDATASVQN